MEVELEVVLLDDIDVGENTPVDVMDVEVDVVVVALVDPVDWVETARDALEDAIEDVLKSLAAVVVNDVVLLALVLLEAIVTLEVEEATLRD
eukprot:1562737-Amphidinium_carterae.1